MKTTSEEDIFSVNKKGIAYAIFAFFYEVLVCLVYGLLFSFNTDLTTSYQIDYLLLFSALAILAVVGFGLINAYITHSGFSGMALTLLTFALTIQHYFMMRAFWDKAGAHDANSK